MTEIIFENYDEYMNHILKNEPEGSERLNGWIERADEILSGVSDLILDGETLERARYKPAYT